MNPCCGREHARQQFGDWIWSRCETGLAANSKAKLETLDLYSMSIFDNLPMCPASECRPRLRRMLVNGGMANWYDGHHTRVLCHIPALHGPMQRLPWPFSMIQPHLIDFRIYDGRDWAMSGVEPVHQQLYKKSHMNDAIGAFLRGAEPNDAIVITED